jgi:hypothetical protein
MTVFLFSQKYNICLVACGSHLLQLSGDAAARPDFLRKP